jgi:sugar phosphate isomerase/epimerase
MLVGISFKRKRDKRFMTIKKFIIMGINHQFIYPEALSDAGAHTRTLEKIVRDDNFEALDFWISAETPNREKEISIVRNSGKFLNYNIGDRRGEKIVIPASPDSGEQEYALETMKREIDMALECGAKKIIFGSGPDFPGDRAEAKKRLSGFILEAFKRVPQEITIAMEPTDRDLDKHFLFGPFKESAAFAEDLRRQGMKNFTLLVDMGHIPLLDISIEEALDETAPYIGHIHLGNCLIKDKSHPLYGDKHVPWDFPGGEYGENDAAVFIKKLFQIGYINNKERNTVSFEMRPFGDLGSERSAQKFVDILDRVLETVYIN